MFAWAWAMLFSGLIVGALAGWMLCILVTVNCGYNQQEQIARLRRALDCFYEFTEPYHDDQKVASVRYFAQRLLEKEN